MIFGNGCIDCVKNSKCKRPCQRPNEFWGVPSNFGTGIEIAVNQVAAGAFKITVTQTVNGIVSKIHETNRIFRSTSADGLAHRLQTRRFPEAQVQYWNTPAYA